MKFEGQKGHLVIKNLVIKNLEKFPNILKSWVQTQLGNRVANSVVTCMQVSSSVYLYMELSLGLSKDVKVISYNLNDIIPKSYK